MKYTLIVIFLIVHNCFYAQTKIEFPSDLKFDPLNYELSLLKIKEIEQISKHSYFNSSSQVLDSVNSTFGLDYVLSYDSNNRLISMKYDFAKEFDLNILSDNAPVQIEIHNAEDKLYKFSIGKDTAFYNYYEREYIYSNGSINSIKFHTPIRSFYDGVFIQEHIPMNQCEENIIEKGLLIKKQLFRDGKLTWTIEYYYKTFTINNREINLLERLIEKSENKIQIETRLKYSF